MNNLGMNKPKIKDRGMNNLEMNNPDMNYSGTNNSLGTNYLAMNCQKMNLLRINYLDMSNLEWICGNELHYDPLMMLQKEAPRKVAKMVWISIQFSFVENDGCFLGACYLISSHSKVEIV